MLPFPCLKAVLQHARFLPPLESRCSSVLHLLSPLGRSVLPHMLPPLPSGAVTHPALPKSRQLRAAVQYRRVRTGATVVCLKGIQSSRWVMEQDTGPGRDPHSEGSCACSGSVWEAAPSILSWCCPMQPLALRALQALVLPLQRVTAGSLGLGALRAVQDQTSRCCSCRSVRGSSQDARGHIAQPEQHLPAPGLKGRGWVLGQTLPGAHRDTCGHPVWCWSRRWEPCPPPAHALPWRGCGSEDGAADLPP